MAGKSKILLTGATGYIGGRLLRSLKEKGCHVRCMARRPEALKHQIDKRTEIVYGDPLKRESLDEGNVFKDIDVAFYFVHSLGSKESFLVQDRLAAQNFSEVAKANGVKRIIYLGGLADPDEQLSDHLKSRLETGDHLRISGIQVIEFRASIILGSGSLSFEMIRALVERLPVMIIPRWLRMAAQPIAIEDVIAYLIAAIDLKTDQSEIFEIGGANKMTYQGIMKEYARQKGLKRLMIPVPVLTPKLSSLWLGLVTPLYARVGKKLVDSIKHPTIVRDRRALEVFDIKPKTGKNAITQALCNEEREFAETKWSDALSAAGNVPRDWGGVRFGNRIIDAREAKVNVPPEKAFEPIRHIGGDTGWYYANWLWNLRGFLDLLIGGVGVRRGRRDPEHAYIGDAIDFWRVQGYEPNKRLRLLAEMKLPAQAWLNFDVEPDPDKDGGSIIHQTVEYDPIGLWGILYWYLVYPLHIFIFPGLIRNIARIAEKNS
ncbi:SDR family oxidoreductase [candidate division KSB1 bacterium]|nr:SDR family oxidoreductase [candidate division KSB1 bacterium]